MNEEIYNIFIRQINALEEKCRLIEIENIKLKTENDDVNKFCGHLLSEIDFLKSIITNTSSIISNTHQQNTDNSFEFDRLLNDYDINRNENTLIELFDKFPDKHKNILTAIRETLPENIHELAEIYQFENDLELLLKSNKLIGTLENNERFEKCGPLELVDKYIRSYNSNNKTAAYRYVKQALIYFPLTYEEQFLDRIQAYQFKDFNEKFEEMFNEMYKNNVIKTELIKESEEKFSRLDYSNDSAINLATTLKNRNNRCDLRSRALFAINAMKKKKRDDADIHIFVHEINKKLRKKITYENN